MTYSINVSGPAHFEDGNVNKLIFTGDKKNVNIDVAFNNFQFDDDIEKILANTKGDYAFSVRDNGLVGDFELAEDAVVFKLLWFARDRNKENVDGTFRPR